MASNVEHDVAQALLNLSNTRDTKTDGSNGSGDLGNISRRKITFSQVKLKIVSDSQMERCENVLNKLDRKLKALFVTGNPCNSKKSQIEQDLNEHKIEEIYNKFKEKGSQEENRSEKKRTQAIVEAGSSQIRICEDPALNTGNDEMIPIGKGHAKVPSRVLTSIPWNSYTKATRTLLEAIFPRSVLATHSLTGKQSPAFMDRPAKEILNPKLVDDIVITVSTRCRVSKSLVRKCITVKCADEAKNYRQQNRA